MPDSSLRAIVKRAAHLTPGLRGVLADRNRLRAELAAQRQEAAAAAELLEEALMARLRLSAEVERLEEEVAALKRAASR